MRLDEIGRFLGREVRGAAIHRKVAGASRERWSGFFVLNCAHNQRWQGAPVHEMTVRYHGSCRSPFVPRCVLSSDLRSDGKLIVGIFY